MHRLVELLQHTQSTYHLVNERVDLVSLYYPKAAVHTRTRASTSTRYFKRRADCQKHSARSNKGDEMISGQENKPANTGLHECIRSWLRVHANKARGDTSLRIQCEFKKDMTRSSTSTLRASSSSSKFQHPPDSVTVTRSYEENHCISERVYAQSKKRARRMRTSTSTLAFQKTYALRETLGTTRPRLKETLN
ncbi:hypothetical protein BJ508DRAFT_307824 [Ascobolus immersus RN42]|uniref:Uncharacterized protein n=1 Tax=Ascobolus immersus RN42 TaxID=1160509 RepID=A0A3N4I723_ASCIM|nr:hypothetical protein BJ508DRAFT_307824 [Ascobolus immersus RN42]